MKTYQKHGTCKRVQGTAFPVHVNGKMRWASLRDLLAMVPTGESVAFGMLPDVGGTEFDRIFSVVGDGHDWGIRTEHARGFPNPWPHITLCPSLTEARAALAVLAAQYEADPQWARRN